MRAERSLDAERFDPPLVVRRFVVAESLSLNELLAAAARQLEGTSASAERAFWHGGIHVNGQPLASEAPPMQVAADSWVAVYAFEREPEPVPVEWLRVLHDGDGLVAVDKPPWLPMQRTRASARLSLEATLRRQQGDDALVAVHRLDRQTSGVAVFARGRAGAWASRALAARQVRKRYLAIVAPAPARDAFSVTGWLARAPDAARFRFALGDEHAKGARHSATRFAVLQRCGERGLVEAWPDTGRTHQLRVHLASVATPVVGDDLYGPPFAAGATTSAARILLHAAQLELHREDGTWLQLEAEAPGDLSAALSR